MTVTTRQAIDASFSSRGWTYDRWARSFGGNRDSQLIDFSRIYVLLASPLVRAFSPRSRFRPIC